MEYTAEDLIAHKLQRAGILISKPKFDRDGTDLMGLMEVKGGSRFCRIQCKGRSLINSDTSSIKIPKDYVQGAFVAFLYIDDGNNENTWVYNFFVGDIRNWKLNDKNEYILNLKKSSFTEDLAGHEFSVDSIQKIKDVINKSDVHNEIINITPPSYRSFIAHRDKSETVSVEENPLGQFVTTVTNTATGIASTGHFHPGKPGDFERDSLGIWTAKSDPSSSDDT